MSDIKSAVILCMYLSICPVTHISTTVTAIDVKVCMTAALPFGHKVSPFGGNNCRSHFRVGFGASKKLAI